MRANCNQENSSMRMAMIAQTSDAGEAGFKTLWCDQYLLRLATAAALGGRRRQSDAQRWQARSVTFMLSRAVRSTWLPVMVLHATMFAGRRRQPDAQRRQARLRTSTGACYSELLCSSWLRMCVHNDTAARAAACLLAQETCASFPCLTR